MFKRVALFLATNLAVMVVASIVFNLLGLSKFTARLTPSTIRIATKR